MRRLTLALIAAAVAAPALAQTPPAILGDRYVPAPWWMREPVIASIGEVKTEIPANRAYFSASFTALDRSAPDAVKVAADKVRPLGERLRAYGAARVQVETQFATQPIYEQYRDKDGNLIANQRADKIDRYQVTASLRIQVRDIKLVEEVYAAVIAARPTNAGSVSFSLDPGDETRTWLYTEAIKDAARRARLAVEAAGGKLGPIKVIDPTGRACRTDVLAGWPSYSSGGALPTTVESLKREDRVEYQGAPPPPPPPPARPDVAPAEPQDLRLPLQPPMQSLQTSACVVYGVG